MTYCNNRQCPHKDCQHHLCHAPNGFAVTTIEMDKTCQRYTEYLAHEEEVKQLSARMTYGDAYVIFSNIDTVDLDDRVKGTAIMKVANMETHNGVKKDDMVKVIKYLLGLAFEFEEAYPDE